MLNKIVGLDITTGHGADSFFYINAIKDPWAEFSLNQTINLAINHKQVLYPLPSNKAKEELNPSDLPQIFANGQYIGIIPYLAKTADDIIFPEELLSNQYTLFSNWALQNPIPLIEWATYHRETPSFFNAGLN